MAYQAGASLNTFFDMMMQKRAQDIQVQEFEAQMRQRQQEQMMQMAQRASSQIGGAMLGAQQQRQTDAIYNRMANQMTPPRAEAANPDIAARMSQMGLGGTKPFTGGKEEMMAQMQAAQAVQGMYAQKALEDQRRIQTAKIAMDSSSKPFQDANKNYNAYTKNLDAHMGAIQTAIDSGNKELYDNAVNSANGLYQSIKSTNPQINITPPVIPPFVTPAQRQAIQAAQQSLGALQAAPPAEGSWIGNTLQAIGQKVGLGDYNMPGTSAKDAIAAQQAEIAAKQKEMMALPGAQEYFAKTPGAAATAGAGAMTGNVNVGQVVNGRPIGFRAINPQTKEVLIWDGNKFVKPQ